MKALLCFIIALGISPPLWAWAADAPAPQPVDNSKADESFKSMDTNNKGYISFEDFRKRHPNMQRPAFDAIDGNSDGMISLEEWRIFFQNHGRTNAMPPPERGMSGQMPPSGHGSGQDGRPLILPPAR